MQVLMINGSPNPEGCTYTALSQVAEQLTENNIQVKWLQVGRKPIRGCIACGKCRMDENLNRCTFDGDPVNDGLALMQECDGLVVGSPVYYAAASGALTSLLNRMFYAGSCFAHKPGAAVVSCRRAGSTAAIEQLNKYFTISQMPLVSSQYWPMVHGNTPAQVQQDLEGMQIMRTLGRNMAWLLKCIELGKKSGVIPEYPETRVGTNFIR